MPNIYENIEVPVAGDERTELLSHSGGVRIERIVSNGHISPKEFWYDETDDEWVLIVRGSARLRFKNPDEVIELSAGDSVMIPAHRRHRVDWTTPDSPTIWLAVFTRPSP